MIHYVYYMVSVTNVTNFVYWSNFINKSHTAVTKFTCTKITLKSFKTFLNALRYMLSEIHLTGDIYMYISHFIVQKK